MKVELLYATIGPGVGGGATIQDNIISALGALPDCRHEFYLLAWESLPPSLQLGRNVRCVSLERPLSERVLRRVAHRSRSLVAKFRGQPPPPFPFQARLAATKRDLGLQLALVIQPFFLPVRDLPYIATVWDLEHRIKPIFPEVSADNTYEIREQHFSHHLGKATRIVVGTPEGARQIEHFYGIPPERIAIIPMPTPAFALDADNRAGSRPSALPAGLDGNFVFYPAQFWPHKNHIALLHALAILQREHGLRLPLVLSGSDKGNKAHIESVATTLGLREHVHFVGFVSNDELIWLYRNALALGFVSFFGPDNLPPLEAFALGCPVLAARLTGVEEQLGDGAVLADPANEREIAAALRRIATDAAFRTALVQRGAARARIATPATYAQQLCALIDEIERYRRCWP